jgi:hypothetical protein
MAFVRHSSRIALLLLAAIAVFITPAAAQQEVQIMVNGPWAYAPGSSSSTIFIVAPMSAGHGPVVIFSGEHAENYPPVANGTATGTRISVTGQFTLTISSLAQCIRTTPLPTETPQKAYPLPNVAAPLIQKAINNGFAISLPKPCYATTMADNFSRIDTVSPPLKEGSYTDWMILHYFVNAVDKITIGGQPILFKQVDVGPFPAVTIAMGPMTGNISDSQCDSMSVASFLDEALLFGQNLHVHFPRLLPPDPGTQTHHYIFGCDDKRPAFFAPPVSVLGDIDTVQFYLSNHVSEKKQSATSAFGRIEHTICGLSDIPTNVQHELHAVAVTLEFKEIDNTKNTCSSPGPIQSGPPLGHAKAYIEQLASAAGAGDCRGAQLNINTTLQ